MINKDYINKSAYHLTDEELKKVLFDSVSVMCRMVSATTKEEAVNFLMDSIVIRIIRKQFNDFTCNQLDSCFEAAAYGIYGTYTKITGQLIVAWLHKKREEIFKDAEEIERRDATNRREKSILTCSNGGYAVLLFLYYHENKMDEIPFSVRLKLIEENGICPNTGVPIRQVINTYLKAK